MNALVLDHFGARVAMGRRLSTHVRRALTPGLRLVQDPGDDQTPVRLRCGVLYLFSFDLEGDPKTSWLFGR